MSTSQDSVITVGWLDTTPIIVAIAMAPSRMLNLGLLILEMELLAVLGSWLTSHKVMLQTTLVLAIWP